MFSINLEDPWFQYTAYGETPKSENIDTYTGTDICSWSTVTALITLTIHYVTKCIINLAYGLQVLITVVFCKVEKMCYLVFIRL